MTEALTAASRLSLAILVCAGLWWIIGWLLGALYPRLRERILRTPPPMQTHLLLAYSALPLLLSFLISLMLWRPSQSLHWVSVHCHADIGCVPHAPTVEHSLLLAVLMALAVGLITLFTLKLILQIHQHLQRYRQLQPYAERQTEAGYWRLDYAPMLALTVGLFRPQIFLSEGLLRRLPPAQVAAVLAHERAHCRRRDGLRLALATLWAPARLGDPQGPLLHDLRLAAELCCDLAAAREIGDPLRVAEAMIQAHRYLRQPGSDALHAATGGGGPVDAATRKAGGAPPDVVLRVTQLIAAPPTRISPLVVVFVLLATTALLTALLGVNLLHYTVEWLLG